MIDKLWILYNRYRLNNYGRSPDIIIVGFRLYEYMIFKLNTKTGFCIRQSDNTARLFGVEIIVDRNSEWRFEFGKTYSGISVVNFIEEIKSEVSDNE